MNATNPSPPDPFFARKMTGRHFLTLRRSLAVGGMLALLTGLVLASRSDSADGDSVTAVDSKLVSNRAEKAAEPTPLVVEVAAAELVDSFTIARTYAGLVAAGRTSRLGFERSARVMELRVDQGDPVTKGQTLAILDTRQLEIERERLAAQRDQAAALLDELQAGPRVETIAVARAEVQDLAAQLELQRRNLTRTTELVRQNAVSREQHDEAELGLESSAAKLEAANKRLDELEAGTRPEQIDAQRAVVNQLSASLNDIAIEIEDSTLVAPFDGTIAIRQVDEGTVVAPAEPIFEIVERGGLEAQIGLPPSVFRALSLGQSVEVEVGDRLWPAKLTRAAALVDLRTRTRTAIFAFDSDGSGVLQGESPQAMDTLVPGEVARVSFDDVTSEQGFWVPTRALIRSTRGLWALYVAETAVPQSGESANDVFIVSRRDVEVLHTDGERSFLRGLLQAGDLIIVSGTQRVVPGQQVRTSIARAPGT